MPRFWPDGRTRESRLPRPFPGGRFKNWKQIAEARRFTPWIIVDNLSEQLWLRDALNDPDVRTTWRPDTGLEGLTIRDGRHRYRIQDSGAVWGLPATEETCELLEELMALCGVGRWAYPSTLGMETMRACYPAEAPLLPAPRGELWHLLWQTSVGGRVDTLRLGEQFPTAYELDMNGAYPTAMRSVPGGYPRRIYGRGRHTPSYRHYQWRVPKDLPLGPLHHRLRDGTVIYPREAGFEADGWYWDHEIEAARIVDVECDEDMGWAWDSLSSDFSRWSGRMWQLRQMAPEPIADLLKLVMVAGIGALGAVHRTGQLKPLSEWPMLPPMRDPQRGLSREWGILETAPVEGGLLHISSYVRSRVRTWLFEEAWFYACRGTLISTDYDAMRIAEPPVSALPEGLGGWKCKELHNVMVPKPRWIVSDEKVRTPGVSR